MEPKRPRTQTSLFRCAHKGRREGDNGLRPPSVPFPCSLAVHHQSLAFRARLCHAKNEAPEEEAGVEMRPAVVSGIVTRDAPVSYCSSFFPVPSNNPRSLYKTQLVLETVNPFEIKFNNELTIVTSFSCTSSLFQWTKQRQNDSKNRNSHTGNNPILHNSWRTCDLNKRDLMSDRVTVIVSFAFTANGKREI